MEVLEPALLAELAEFMGYIKSTWSARAVVDAAEGGAGAAVRDESFSASLQVLRSEALLRVRGQEVLDAAAVASSARRFLAGFKALFVCCAEVDRLTKAVDKLVRLFSLDAAATEDEMDVDGDAVTEDAMDVDGRPAPGARHRQEGSGRSCASAGSVAAPLPSPVAKRKRAWGGGGEVDTVQPQKRRLLAWMRPHQWLPSGSGWVSSALREPPPPPALPRSRHARTVALARSRIRRPIGKPDARTVALARSRIRRRIGKPTMARHRSQPSLGQHFSLITL